MAGVNEKDSADGRKSGGGSREENNNSSGVVVSPRKKKLENVIIRMSDGLLRSGKVIKFERLKQRYLVQLTTGVKTWVLDKDIVQKKSRGRPKRSQAEITCSVCQGEESRIPNEIVLCDQCGAGYHQECHTPTIPQEVLTPSAPWLCKDCSSAATAGKKSSTPQKGMSVHTQQLKKQALSYNIASLEWDPGHKANKQQRYCYCGGPGQWYKKMLQCSRCKQWFHEACIQCLKYPLLYGDRFYIFICSLCNSGPEYVQRLELRWLDIVQLAVFNLTAQHVTKYYDAYETIVPWVESHAKKLQCTRFHELPKAKRCEKIVNLLRNNEDMFCSGKEIKKRASLYGLRVRMPPDVPNYSIPATGTVVEEVMGNLKESGVKIKTIIPNNIAVPIQLTSKTFKRKATSEPGDFTRIVKKARKLINQSATSQNNAQVKKSRQRLPLLNGHLPTDSNPKQDCESPSPKKTSLEAIIPRLSNYDGFNHPFKTVLERNQEIEHRKFKDLLLNSYSNGADLETDSLSESASEAASSSASTNVREDAPQYLVRRKKRGRKSQAEIAYMDAVVASRDKALKKVKSARRGKPQPQSELLTKNVVDKNTLDRMKKQEISMNQLKSSVNSYFGAANRLAYGEKFQVQARRLDKEGKVQYLVEWEGGVIG